jgi:cyclopropane-fatty-acyl-phospholipid synthase
MSSHKLTPATLGVKGVSLATVQKTANPQVAASLCVLADLMGDHRPRDFSVRFWDGSMWELEPGQPANFALVLKHPGSLRKMFWPPRGLTLGKAYIYDDFDVEGDMVAFMLLVRHLALRRLELPMSRKLRLGWQLWSLPRVERPQLGRQGAQLSGRIHSLERDRAAISYHYDTSNEFFERFLGPSCVYTSGLWDNPAEDLEAAQTRKLDYVCRKLRLKPGERLLDIGCGWGAPLIHAVRNYGVDGLGVTLSSKQADWSRAKIKQAGLEDRCRIEIRDYRELDVRQTFDKIVMLEVGEHFGADQFVGYFRKCFELLKPGGALAVQQITLFGQEGMPLAHDFSQHYIFPDGELVPVSTLVRDAERAGFEVRDVESIREHYPLTLKHWLGNLEAHHDELVKLTDEATYRTFRLYLSGARMGFLINVYNLYQLLAVKPDHWDNRLPQSRRD